jgi:hypothetical protein
MSEKENSPTQSVFAWRKTRRPLLLKIAFVLVLTGFTLGYNGGVYDNASVITLAFAVWGVAAALAILVKS